MDEHAQYEIRVYANAMAQIVQDLVPIAWQAFVDYELNAVRFSGPEMEILGMLLQARQILLQDNEVDLVAKEVGMGKREREEFKIKVAKLRLPPKDE